MRRALAAAVVVVLAAVAPAAQAAPARRPRVLLFGDSLLVEATPHVKAMAAAAGVDVEIHARGGTAVCDWLAEAPGDRARFRPDVSVLAFAGNSLTPCTRDARAQQLSGAALGVRYARDLDAMITILRPAGPVYGVRPPARRWWNVSAQAVEAAVTDAARMRTVRLVDGGALISPGGTWTAAQPCLADEPCTGPVVYGGRENVVRSPDGLHFCPSGYHKGECEQWSSGAFRYARSITAPVFRDLRH